MADAVPPPKSSNVVKRLLCVATSPEPSRQDGWSVDGDTLTLSLAATPELTPLGGALRLEGNALPDRLLVVHGIDDAYYAYANHCACAGFRIDPVPGEAKIRCCTLMRSTYDYAGNVLGSHPDKGLTVYPVTRDGDALRVDLSSPRVMGKADAH